MNQVKEAVAAVHKNENSPQLYSHDVMLKGRITDTHNHAIQLEHNVPPLDSYMTQLTDSEDNQVGGNSLNYQSNTISHDTYNNRGSSNNIGGISNADEPRVAVKSRQDESPSPPPLLGNSTNLYDTPLALGPPIPRQSLFEFE